MFIVLFRDVVQTLEHDGSSNWRDVESASWESCLLKGKNRSKKITLCKIQAAWRVVAKSEGFRWRDILEKYSCASLNGLCAGACIMSGGCPWRDTLVPVSNGLCEGAWSSLRVFLGEILLRDTLVPVLKWLVWRRVVKSEGFSWWDTLERYSCASFKMACVKVRGQVWGFFLERYSWEILLCQF